MGFKFLVERSIRSVVISTIYSPKHPNYNFEVFYNYLKERGMCIYPGKLTEIDTFRIGSIGDLDNNEMYDLVREFKNAFQLMGVPLPLTE